MKSRTPPRYPNLLLVTGVVVGLAGGLLLLGNFGYLPQAGALWPVPVILVGLIFLYLAWPRKRSDRWIIPGMVLTLGGIVLLLMNTVLQAQSIAPHLAGRSCWSRASPWCPYGFRKHGSARIAIVVPGLFISVLALVFIPFSLHHTEGGFAAFVRQWWPMILVILGAALDRFIFQHPQAE